MHGGKLTTREAEIVRQLLADRGIHEYEFVQTVNEGRDLPGGTSNGERETDGMLKLFRMEGNYGLWYETVRLDMEGLEKNPNPLILRLALQALMIRNKGFNSQ